jgi:hypothetical protein
MAGRFRRDDESVAALRLWVDNITERERDERIRQRAHANPALDLHRSPHHPNPDLGTDPDRDGGNVRGGAVDAETNANSDDHADATVGRQPRHGGGVGDAP